MKVLDILYPFSEHPRAYAAASSDGRPRARSISGIDVDRTTGRIFLVDARPLSGSRSITELTPESGRIRAVPAAEAAPFSPRGIAVAPGSGDLWLSDEHSPSVLCLRRDGAVMIRIDTAPAGVRHPGVLSFTPDGRSLLVADHGTNLVTEMDLRGRRIGAFELTPFAEARLCGLACDPFSGSLLLAFADPVPERGGAVGESGVFSVDRGGRVIGRHDTNALGFCALDVAFGPRRGLVHAVSREYVLAQTGGDHSHLFSLEMEGVPDPGPNRKAVLSFLLRNNLFGDRTEDPSRGSTLRWSRLPIAVFIEGLIDMERADAEAAFGDWSTATGGAVEFEFVGGRPPTGIVFAQGPYAFCLGGPAPEGTATVCVCDRANLTSHPLGLDERSVQRNVARHEIGHALGFVGHSPRFRVDTMNSISGYSAGISAEEAAFMQTLYALAPETPAGAVLEHDAPGGGTEGGDSPVAPRPEKENPNR